MAEDDVGFVLDESKHQAGHIQCGVGIGVVRDALNERVGAVSQPCDGYFDRAHAVPPMDPVGVSCAVAAPRSAAISSSSQAMSAWVVMTVRRINARV